MHEHAHGLIGAILIVLGGVYLLNSSYTQANDMPALTIATQPTTAPNMHTTSESASDETIVDIRATFIDFSTHIAPARGTTTTEDKSSAYPSSLQPVHNTANNEQVVIIESRTKSSKEPETPHVEETRPSKSRTTTPAETSDYDTLTEPVLAEINVARRKEGLSTLTLDPALTRIAQARSIDMATRDYFSHTSPDGCTLDCNFLASGYKALSWGENIGWYAPYADISSKRLGEKLVHDWLLSKGHRANILSDKFTHIGISTATIGSKILITTTFARPE